MTFKLSILLSVFFALFFLATCQKQEKLVSNIEQDIKIQEQSEDELSLPENIEELRFYYLYSDNQRGIFTNLNLINKNTTLYIKINNEEPVCNFNFEISDEKLDELKLITSNIKYVVKEKKGTGGTGGGGPSEPFRDGGGCYHAAPPAVVPQNACKEITFVKEGGGNIAMGENKDCIYQRAYITKGATELFEFIFSLLDSQEEMSNCPEDWHLAFETE